MDDYVVLARLLATLRPVVSALVAPDRACEPTPSCPVVTCEPAMLTFAWSEACEGAFAWGADGVVDARRIEERWRLSTEGLTIDTVALAGVVDVVVRDGDSGPRAAGIVDLRTPVGTMRGVVSWSYVSDEVFEIEVGFVELSRSGAELELSAPGTAITTIRVVRNPRLAPAGGQLAFRTDAEDRVTLSFALDAAETAVAVAAFGDRAPVAVRLEP